MSYDQATQRADFADRLTGVTAEVDGQSRTLSGHPVQPGGPAAYDAWPIWTATRPVTSCIVETDWIVAVALPGADAQTWAANGDALVGAVIDALEEYRVERVEPGQLLISDGAPVPVLRFTITGI